MKLKNLTCEYFTNPLGIGSSHPRLGWLLDSNRPGAQQSAFQVVCTSEGKVIWDSGKKRSSQSVHVEYAGKPLLSGQRVEWKARVWDGAGKASPFSAPARWEMGLLDRSDWGADWIGSPVVGGPRTPAPCPMVCKVFTLTKPVLRARLYVTALGLYEASLNGTDVTDEVFAPGWPDYRKRTLYQTYDVTRLLRKGKNVLGALLGDGWYCGQPAWFTRQHYGDRPRFMARLTVTFLDGSTQAVMTDPTWKTATGPLLESDILNGESYDARLEVPGWNRPGFNHGRWDDVLVFPDPGIARIGKQGAPVRRILEIKPVAGPDSRNIVDFGQNFTGRVRLKVKGPAGSTVTLLFAETLKPDGTLYRENLRAARCTDSYTLKGKGTEVYEPRFTFHGFRYVQLKGFPGIPSRKSVTGIVIHSDMPVTGEFRCSDPLLNQLQRNITWGLRSNFLDIPTDCPQRDERLGWTGDAQVFIRTAAFNRQVAPFFTKWLADAVISQAPDGGVPSVIPNLNDRDTDGGPAWADAFIICPWTVYLCYGDTRLLREMYAPVKRFVDSLHKASRCAIRSNPSWTSDWDGYGDWLAQDGTGKISGGTPKELIGTAFFAHAARLMAAIAKATGNKGDKARYGRLFETVRAAFNRRFVTRDGLVIGQTQTAYVLALHFDLLPPEMRPGIANDLVKDIQSRGWRLSTGFVGTPYLMHVLSRFGKLDTAYKLLFQKNWPSWLYPVTQGATTIWERWDGWTHDRGFQDPGMNSFNHYAYGAVGDWLYQVVAGINIDPDAPGYKRIIFRPQPGGGLTHARAALQSMYGPVASEWKIRKKRFELKISVPPNTSAQLFLPGETRGRAVAAGEHRFSKPWVGPGALRAKK